MPDARAVQHCFEDLAQTSSASMHRLESETVLSECSGSLSGSFAHKWPS